MRNTFEEVTMPRVLGCLGGISAAITIAAVAMTLHNNAQQNEERCEQTIDTFDLRVEEQVTALLASAEKIGKTYSIRVDRQPKGTSAICRVEGVSGQFDGTVFSTTITDMGEIQDFSAPTPAQ